MTNTAPKSVAWRGNVDGCLVLLDQTKLPGECVFLDCLDVPTVWEAIKQLRVRGAPAIGIAAAYGVCVAVRESMTGQWNWGQFYKTAQEAIDYLATSRPTAVNLFWALQRMERKLKSLDGSASEVAAQELLAEASAIHAEDIAMCHAIGRAGAELLTDGGVLTHCNTGGLATSEYGTALSVLFTAHDQGKKLNVYADETRPLLQGARLTAWELMQHGVPVTLITDSMAAQVMREGKVQAVIIGADRITSRGDAANKIGSYGLAILAKYHRIPFYVAAPSSTFDFKMESGADIPIEQRSAEEITEPFGKRIAPVGVPTYNPAFDVTPAELITALITEKGVIQPVTKENIAATLQ
ncbi:MAG: S-methyl-5-thioribose-1-phosphate isomerase [Planctomycetes bacterium]|nr:S-methyl-5-thioribose-1-phosphate isomerase [Planctomycetota bacterium]